MYNCVINTINYMEERKVMSKLKEADFYYGAVLSTLLNNKITPVLIESGNDRQIYDFTTDSKDFRLIVKYRSYEIKTKKKDYCSWQFNLSDDIADLKQGMKSDKKLSLGLVCGKIKLNKSEYAVLHKDEIKEILDSGKESITISRKKGEKAFRISMGGGRQKSMKIESNRYV